VELDGALEDSRFAIAAANVTKEMAANASIARRVLIDGRSLAPGQLIA